MRAMAQSAINLFSAEEFSFFAFGGVWRHYSRVAIFMIFCAILRQNSCQKGRPVIL